MVYFEKSQPAPASLAIEKEKSNGSYREQDVMKQLRADFHDKCYICESKGLTSINVEHFLPHKGNKELKFDWSNLFYSCSHCNNVKQSRDIFNDILNCTNKEDKVDEQIRYRMDPFPKSIVQIDAVIRNTKVCNTVEFLKAVYNGSNTGIKEIESDNLRENLLNEIFQFQCLLIEYFDRNTTDEERTELISKIKKALSNHTAFTAFKRWIIRDNPDLVTTFSPYLDFL